MPPRLSVEDVARLIGAEFAEVERLIDLGYLPERSEDGSVSLRAFVALLRRSISHPRLQRLRIAERAVWIWVLSRNPGFLNAVLGIRFSAGTLGEVVQAKLFRDGALEDDDETA